MKDPTTEAALREALAINPASGADWWTLANLESVALSERDINAMTVALATPMLSDADQRHLHLALAKVLETRGEDENARRHLDLANRIAG